MHVYDNVGDTIVHKISTPLVPKFIDLQKKVVNKKKTWIFIYYPRCPFRLAFTHSTNRRRQSSKLWSPLEENDTQSYLFHNKKQEACFLLLVHHGFHHLIELYIPVVFLDRQIKLLDIELCLKKDSNNVKHLIVLIISLLVNCACRTT